jgi:hypothetical protein
MPALAVVQQACKMKQHIKTHITGSVEFVVRILNATFVFSLQITTNINFDFSETKYASPISPRPPHTRISIASSFSFDDAFTEPFRIPHFHFSEFCRRQHSGERMGLLSKGHECEDLD